VRFGLGPLTGQALDGPADELATVLAATRLAEQSGLDDVWISEHHATGDGHISSPLAVLAALAASTSTISLGTDIAIAPLYHPQRLLADADQVSRLSGGRLMLGLGAGYRSAEFEAFGVPGRERFRRLEDAVRTLRSQQTAAAGGRSQAQLPRWPVLLAGMREAGVRRAGRLADGWIAPTLNHVGQLTRRIDWLAGEGAFSRQFHLVINLTVFVGDRAASRRARHGVSVVEQRYLAWSGESGQAKVPGPPPAGTGPQIPPHAIVATAGECAEALAPWCQALLGTPANVIPHLSARLHFPGVGHDETLHSVQQFATQVVPRLATSGDLAATP
jgi:alkanesulfonate monooxygenase SsuD/methylene tetrahydromethanopterin reductase-like flavin-dependent oxidoreductase (luciferase family)